MQLDIMQPQVFQVDVSKYSYVDLILDRLSEADEMNKRSHTWHSDNLFRMRDHTEAMYLPKG